MHCVRHIMTAVFVLIHAQAMQLKANSSGLSGLRGVYKSGDVQCSVEGDCIIGSRMGTCFVSLDAFSVPDTVVSTDVGQNADFIVRGTVQHGRKLQYRKLS